MRNHAYMILLLCLTMNAGAQGFVFKPYELSVEVFKTDGRPFVNPATDIEGSPFYIEEWKPASVLLKSDKTVGNVKMRLNLQTQEVHFLDKNNVEMAVPSGLLKEVRFLMSPGPDSLVLVFRNGFPSIDRQDANNFYWVLSEGRIGLICALSKSISTQKNPVSGEVKKEYTAYEHYYLLKNGTLIRLKKDKEFIINQLEDKKDQVSEFVHQHTLNYRSIEDIKMIISFYNTLI